MAPEGRREQSAEKLQLRLFVSGATPRSMRAIAVVRKLCETASAEGYDLEVIDIYQDPAAARDHQIVALPTLVKMSPVPKRMFIGDMSDIGPLEAGLGLSGEARAGLSGDDEGR
jgi:circadian clock protein KaiB